MQAFDDNEFPMGPVMPFDEDVINEVLDRPGVHHVKKFSMAQDGPCKTPFMVKVKKARKKNRAARMARRKNRKK